MDALEKIKYFLLVFLVFMLPVGSLSRIDLGNAIAFTLNDVLVGCLAVIYGASVIFKRKIKGNLLKPILIFVVILIVSLLVNFKKLNTLEFLVSGSYILRWIAYSTIYFSVIELSPPLKRNIKKYLGLSALIYVLLGFIQFAIYPNLRNLFYSGWDEHLYRTFGTILDPNFSGLIFVLFFILLLTQRIIFPNEKLRYLALILTFVSILLTFSRTSILALITSIIFYLILKKDKTIAYALILGIFIISMFYIVVPKKESTNIFRTASTFARLESYQRGINIFKDNSIIGVGFNSYRYALEDYGFSDEMKYGPSHGASGNDNSFLFILATSGIFGFCAFLYLIYNIIRQKSNNVIRNLSILTVIVGSLFVNAFFFVFIMEWIWIIVGSTENT